LTLVGIFWFFSFFTTRTSRNFIDLPFFLFVLFPPPSGVRAFSYTAGFPPAPNALQRLARVLVTLFMAVFSSPLVGLLVVGSFCLGRAGPPLFLFVCAFSLPVGLFFLFFSLGRFAFFTAITPKASLHRSRSPKYPSCPPVFSLPPVSPSTLPAPLFLPPHVFLRFFFPGWSTCLFPHLRVPGWAITQRFFCWGVFSLPAQFYTAHIFFPPSPPVAFPILHFYFPFFQEPPWAPAHPTLKPCTPPFIVTTPLFSCPLSSPFIRKILLNSNFFCSLLARDPVKLTLAFRVSI